MGRARWWPAVLILVFWTGWMGWTWLLADYIRQYRVLRTISGTLLAFLALLLWFAFLSRLPRRVRFGTALAVLLAGGLAASVLRIRGVTGDLVPILAFRWTNAEAPPATPLTVRPTVAVPAAQTAPSPNASPSPAPPGSAASPGAIPGATSAPESSRATPLAGLAPGTLRLDYPQFLGPNRDGTVRGVRLARDWSAQPPRRLWRQAIGAGWSGFAVVGDAVVTQEQQGAEERVVAYDRRSGRVLWTHADRVRYDSTIAGDGPRATPTIHAGRVFSVGSTGLLNALDLATGARLWSHDIVTENGAVRPEWGKSCSPLVVDGRVIVSAGADAGRSLVAYDATTGQQVWSGGNDQSGYGSPVLALLAGRPQVLIFNLGSVVAHDPQSGAVLWQHAWPAQQPNVANPVLLPGDRVLLSSGYGIGSKLFQVAPGLDGSLQARLVWETPRLKAKFANLIERRGDVYGLDDGVLTCLDPATGERRWRDGRYGHGQVILVEDLLLVQTEDGQLVLVEPSPDRLIERSRFQALDDKTWNPPALAGSMLLVRNDREAAAYELPVEK